MAKVITEEVPFKHDGDEPATSADRWQGKRHPICINSLSSERIASPGGECRRRMSTCLASHDEVMHLCFFFLNTASYKPRAISSVLEIRKADVFSADTHVDATGTVLCCACLAPSLVLLQPASWHIPGGKRGNSGK